MKTLDIIGVAIAMLFGCVIFAIVILGMGGA